MKTVGHGGGVRFDGRAREYTSPLEPLIRCDRDH